MPRPLLAVATTQALVAAVALVACRAPTQVSLEITTDIACSDHASTTVAVSTPATVETAAPVAETKACSGGRIGSLVLVPSGSADAALVVRVVTALAPSTPEACVATGYTAPGCIVARRSLRYVPNEEIRLPIAMRVACANVPCGTTETCVRGLCRPAALDGARCTAPLACDESVLEGGPSPPAADAGPVVDAAAPPPPPPDDDDDDDRDAGTPPLDAGRCADLGGAVHSPDTGHCYWVPPGGALDAGGARALCTRRTARAEGASITSAAENELVAAVAAGREELWIGLFSQSTTPRAESFRWIDGAPAGFALWAPGFPKGNGQCVVRRPDGLWENRSCFERHEGICERR